MKQIITLILLLAVVFSSSAQESKWPKVDVSNMDAEYYPANVAWRNYLGEDERNKRPQIRLIYSRPMMNNRAIFGTLIPYGKVWRLGANEATEITFYQPVGIAGTMVNPGTYSVSALVNEKDWEIRFSSQLGIWGAAKMDESKIVAKAKVPVTMKSNSEELLCMSFRQLDDLTAGLVIQWDKTMVELPIAFNPVEFSNKDKSPMDKVHYPSKSAYTNYLEGEEVNMKPQIQLTYSRPYKKDRVVFGELLKTGDIWRIGANQSTEIVFYEDVTIDGKAFKSGRYVIYAELKQGSWDIIFSKDFPAWGNANRDETKDVGRVNIPTFTEAEVLENLSIIFEEKSDKMVNMVIGWDKTRASMPISFEK